MALYYNELLIDVDGVRYLGEKSESIHRRGKILPLYYLSQALILLGRHDEFRQTITTFLDFHPDHVDASYLFSQFSAYKGTFTAQDRQRLWQILERQVQHSSRRKLWLAISYLVRDAQDLKRMDEAWDQSRQGGMSPDFDFQINDYCATAALRAGEYGYARRLWRENLSHTIRSARVRKPSSAKPKSRLNPDAAFAALQDVTSVLQTAGAEPFLVSGTLLGMARANALLPHDKDVDVGIWDDIPRANIVAALGSSGRFWVLPGRSEETIRVKHINGTPIDVFYHFRDGGSIWHGGHKAHWRNSDFELERREFAHGSFLVPGDIDRYLSENYGDWRTPVTEFDSVYDTPNAMIVNDDEMVIHDYQMACSGLSSARPGRALRYLRNLQAKGEDWTLVETAMEMAS